MKYRVETTDEAFELILEQAKYIAVDCQAPLNAERWLNLVWGAIDGLEEMPRRHGLAPEDQFRPYEVRRVLVENHLILFYINDAERIVVVIGCRHGSRLPQPDDLPPTAP